MRRLRLATVLVLGGLAAAALFVSEGSRGSEPGTVEQAAASGWQGLAGLPRAPVAVGQRVLVVLRAPSLSARVAAAGGLASDSDERGWTAAVLAGQQQFISDMAAKGVQIKPEFRYTRVLDGFSAAIDPRAVPLLERAPEVLGVYPVRVAYPAAVSRSQLPLDLFTRGLGHRPDVSLGGYDGSGVLIGLLDTGVDLNAPFLHGHVLPGVDIVGGGPDARVHTRPDNPRLVELHGTEMAGLLVGLGGPAGLAGVAEGATVLPIRVAGWQRAAQGSYAVYGRTDQIIEGLERAVDPNGDGDAHDAVRVALVPLAEPFGAFTDDPLARAAIGALRLDTLVVAPAGNDGRAGPSFGSLSGPGGAPAALTVGAADLRPREQLAQLVLRTGMHVFLDRPVALAGAFGPRRTLQLTLAAPQRLLDRNGYSLVAGKAVLLPATGSPEQLAAAAAAAGARALLLHGERLPAGALGLDEEAPIPVLTVPEDIARSVLATVKFGQPVVVTLGQTRTRHNDSARAVAPFSSWGFGFAGQLKPELVAVGVAVTTGEPAAAGVVSRFGTINGSSAAAAVVAGAAALLLQARPDLDAAALKSLLVSSAQPLPAEPPQAQGAGLLDVTAAAGLELATEPAAITFGRAQGDGWHASRTILLRNLSTRELTIYVAFRRPAKPQLAITVAPRRLVIPAGESVPLTIGARVAGYPRGVSAAGVLTLTPIGGGALRVPWSAVLGPSPAGLVGSARLSEHTFAPSETTPAVLSFSAGLVLHHAGAEEIQPVLRLDLDLSNSKGKRIGLLARLRDLLPSRLAFGLTGRGPGGHVLPPGTYRLRILAWPTTGGRPSVVSVRFTVTK